MRSGEDGLLLSEETEGGSVVRFADDVKRSEVSE
jgi:hypothetical protein